MNVTVISDFNQSWTFNSDMVLEGLRTCKWRDRDSELTCVLFERFASIFVASLETVYVKDACVCDSYLGHRMLIQLEKVIYRDNGC